MIGKTTDSTGNPVDLLPQNNFDRIMIPTIMSITGKKRIIRIPGIIRKFGSTINKIMTRNKAPKNLRPSSSMIPKAMIRIGSIDPPDQETRFPKKLPRLEKNSPMLGKLMSQPLCLRIQNIPKMMSTHAKKDPECFRCSICFSMT
jgi:hypothetical protein